MVAVPDGQGHRQAEASERASIQCAPRVFVADVPLFLAIAQDHKCPQRWLNWHCQGAQQPDHPPGLVAAAAALIRSLVLLGSGRLLHGHGLRLRLRLRLLFLPLICLFIELTCEIPLHRPGRARAPAPARGSIRLGRLLRRDEGQRWLGRLPGHRLIPLGTHPRHRTAHAPRSVAAASVALPRRRSCGQSQTAARRSTQPTRANRVHLASTAAPRCAPRAEIYFLCRPV